MPDYEVRRPGWIDGAHRPTGAVVTMTERQAGYLLRSGQIGPLAGPAATSRKRRPKPDAETDAGSAPVTDES